MEAVAEELAGSDDAEAILNAAAALKTEIFDCRDEMDAQRRLPRSIVSSLKRAGVFRMTMPREWGGAELDPLSQIRIIETLSTMDASVGWCSMIGGDGGHFSGYIDQSVAREMYADVDAVTGDVLMVTGRAVKVDGGYRISGRFPFASGCHHASWIVVGCKIYDGDKLCTSPDGVPKTRQCFVPGKAISIIDNWHPTGLLGSGSNDIAIDDYFVSEEKTFSFQNLTHHRKSALYRSPFGIRLNFCGVPLGVARAAIDAVIEAGDTNSRPVTIAGKMAPQRKFRDEPVVQDAVGRANATLNAARAYLFSTIGDIWTSMQMQAELSPTQLANFTMVNAYVYGACKEVVDLMYKVRGGPAVYEGNVLDRSLRDVTTINQHIMNSLHSYALGGRILLGLPPEKILL